MVGYTSSTSFDRSYTGEIHKGQGRTPTDIDPDKPPRGTLWASPPRVGKDSGPYDFGRKVRHTHLKPVLLVMAVHVK